MKIKRFLIYLAFLIISANVYSQNKELIKLTANIGTGIGLGTKEYQEGNFIFPKYYNNTDISNVLIGMDFCLTNKIYMGFDYQIIKNFNWEYDGIDVYQGIESIIFSFIPHVQYKFYTKNRFSILSEFGVSKDNIRIESKNESRDFINENFLIEENYKSKSNAHLSVDFEYEIESICLDFSVKYKHYQFDTPFYFDSPINSLYLNIGIVYYIGSPLITNPFIKKRYYLGE